MAEVNLDKIYASFLLSLDDIKDISELPQIEKNYLGKGSVLSEERAKLANLSNEDKKKYGSLLKQFADNVSIKLENFKTDFEKSFINLFFLTKNNNDKNLDLKKYFFKNYKFFSEKSKNKILELLKETN